MGPEYAVAEAESREKNESAGFKTEEAGLPKECRAMILGIENSGKELTIDYVKTILLQGIPKHGLMRKESHNKKVFAAACRKGGSRRRKCFVCESELHLAILSPKRERKCYVCGNESI